MPHTHTDTPTQSIRHIHLVQYIKRNCIWFSFVYCFLCLIMDFHIFLRSFSVWLGRFFHVLLLLLLLQYNLDHFSVRFALFPSPAIPRLSAVFLFRILESTNAKHHFPPFYCGCNSIFISFHCFSVICWAIHRLIKSASCNSHAPYTFGQTKRETQAGLALEASDARRKSHKCTQ